MKKSFFCLLLITLVSGSIKAQLANSKWKGVLELGSPVNVSFEFGKDTLAVMNLDQSSVLETMIYKVTNSTFTLVKVSGQSDCETSTIGKYKYEIKENTLILTTIEDVCEDRGPVLNNLKLVKNT
ncbi:hypothetical protein [Segetibacter aerophilus]|uniref:Lipocalin-like domain-containing protein n=1 Tax=Segetibacter aerophilus TaxID=670293 RepID=A0A512BEN2_9BACT|nr:hypothetical protein [Segetibacter aerophilus]GEO10429.1 hypothetical protein SAE01_29250 [Segetibacter aerophilus]